ncbi:MAG: hypothetical protein ACE5IL_01875 [Myxococcota bacterium]
MSERHAIAKPVPREIRLREVFVAHTYDVERIDEAAAVARERLAGLRGQAQDLTLSSPDYRPFSLSFFSFLSFFSIST